MGNNPTPWRRAEAHRSCTPAHALWRAAEKGPTHPYVSPPQNKSEQEKKGEKNMNERQEMRGKLDEGISSGALQIRAPPLRAPDEGCRPFLESPNRGYGLGP